MPASELPGPAELLAAAFAACVLKNVERFAGMLPSAMTARRSPSMRNHQQTPPRFAECLHPQLVTDEPPDRVDLLHQIVGGRVFNTLAASCDVSGTVRAMSPAPVALV